MSTDKKEAVVVDSKKNSDNSLIKNLKFQMKTSLTMNSVIRAKAKKLDGPVIISSEKIDLENLNNLWHHLQLKLKERKRGGKSFRKALK